MQPFKIIIEALPGDSLSGLFAIAAEICVKYRCQVELTANSIVYLLTPDKAGAA